ncbi:MAG: ribosome biogenesis GTP-binding protein YihA/YsxC [Christensenellaceae bacterium]
MIIKNATFITSAASPSQFIRSTKPIIAVCGKSNVGKSSLINKLASQRKLAKTSSDPGRTRLVNYFDFGEFILADLPGYGYAKVSKEEKAKWAKTLDAFFARKEEIAHVLLLLDIRHEPTEDDEQMIQFLYYHTIPYTVVATKADKLSRMRIKEHIRMLAGNTALTEESIIATSAETGLGKEALLAKIEEVIALFHERDRSSGSSES